MTVEEDSQMRAAADVALPEVMAVPQADSAPEAAAGVEASVSVRTKPAAQEALRLEEDGGALPVQCTQATE
eukprot:12917433-Prorocentrum_lima.AAC.1